MSLAKDIMSSYPVKLVREYSEINDLISPNKSKHMDVICSKETVLKIFRDYGYNIYSQTIYNMKFKIDSYYINCMLTNSQPSLQILFKYNRNFVVDLDFLYGLKRATIHIDSDRWLGDISTIKQFQQNLKEPISTYFWKLRRKEIEKILEYKQPIPDKFVSFIDRQVLFDIVKYGENAILPTIIDNKSKTFKKNWNKLSYSQRVYCILEHVLVVSLERYLIPILYSDNPPSSMNTSNIIMWGFRELITKISKGWYRDCIIDHYSSCINQYSNNDVMLKFDKIIKIVKLNKNKN